jgi:hypothetical protein
VRRGDELHENGGVLDDVRAGLAEGVKNFSFRGCIRRPTEDPPGPTVPPYAAPRRFAKRSSVDSGRRTGEEYALLSAPNS